MSGQSSEEVQRARDGQVASFFAGKDVFITGGSGFVGRVLIEKLLREAPDVGTIFLLLRPKKGVPASERLEKITNVTLFDVVRRQQPAAMGKLHGVEGDAALPGLGLSASDRALLEERVAIVFHAAASVRFDDPLPKAVRLNVRGTRDICELALSMRRLEAFVHVSTAYCNCNRLEIEERLYPPPGDWRTYIELVEEKDPLLLDIFTTKLVDNRINTYIFSKAMAEQVVNEYSQQLPIGILRPSIVTSSEEEPFPGWVDNFYGPTAVIVANGMGILHSNFCDCSIKMDIIPVDYVARAILLAAKELAKNRSSDILPLYNATSDNRNLIQVKESTDATYSISAENRIPRIYKHFPIFTSSVFLFKLIFILIDLPISFALDCIAWWMNQPRRMVKIHRRILIAQLKNYYFSHHTFKFHNLNFLTLNNTLPSIEKPRFHLSTKHILLEPIWLFSQREVKKYFFPMYTVNPGRITVIFEVIHFVLCGMLLFLLWKSSVITTVFGISFYVLKIAVPLSMLQLTT